MLAEACNIGIEPMVRPDIVVLQRDRLAWISQNYLHGETLLAANDRLLAEKIKENCLLLIIFGFLKSLELE